MTYQLSDLNPASRYGSDGFVMDSNGFLAIWFDSLNGHISCFQQFRFHYGG